MTRTCGTQIRNLVLYPPELRGRKGKLIAYQKAMSNFFRWSVEKSIDFGARRYIISFYCGGVAQLGERYVRNVQVRGSNPLISTIWILTCCIYSRFFLFEILRFDQLQFLHTMLTHIENGVEPMKTLKKSPHYLVRTPHSYCFRANVPEDVQRFIGRKELRYSLKTYLIPT